MMERGRRVGSDGAEIVTVPELEAMNPHVASGKRFRSKIIVDGLQDCSSCHAMIVTGKHSRKVLHIDVPTKSSVASMRVPDGASVDMVFFGDIGRRLVGKPVDVLNDGKCRPLTSASKPLEVVLLAREMRHNLLRLLMRVRILHLRKGNEAFRTTPYSRLQSVLLTLLLYGQKHFRNEAFAA